MFKSNSVIKSFAYIFGVVSLTFSLNYAVSAVWVEPASVPPGGNAEIPLNVGSAGQTKIGGLSLNYGTDGTTGGASNGLIIHQGKVGIGTSSPNAKLHILGISETDNFADNIMVQGISNQVTFNPALLARRSRGISEAAKIAVVNNDTLFELVAEGYDGNSFKETANIRVSVDGAVSDEKVPSRIDFRTMDINGVSSDRITIKNNGNVGIGTSNPVGALTVKSDVPVMGQMTFFDKTPGYGDVSMDGGTDSLFTFNNSGADGVNGATYFRAQNGVDPILYLKNNGNVGIGTTNPQNKLHIVPGEIKLESKNANEYTDIHFFNNRAVAPFGREYILGNYAPDMADISLRNKFFIRDGNTGQDRFIIDTVGNVGIGTSAPTDSLHIRQTASEIALESTGIGATNYSHIHFLNAGGQSYGLGAFSPNVADVTRREKFFISDNTGGNILLAIDGKATSPTVGNVGIGTTTPEQKLEVDGGVRLNTTTVRPVCDAAARGTFWFTQGAAGVKDSVAVCAKDALNAYAWRTLY